jgi:hypothetical protein
VGYFFVCTQGNTLGAQFVKDCGGRCFYCRLGFVLVKKSLVRRYASSICLWWGHANGHCVPDA